MTDTKASKVLYKYHSTDNGNCRVYYKRGKGLYCAQPDGSGLCYEMLSCTKDGEPSYPVVIDWNTVEIPVGRQYSTNRELRMFMFGYREGQIKAFENIQRANRITTLEELLAEEKSRD